MSERTVVAIGCSTDDNYAFLLPFTACLWRDVVGHHPFALLVGSEAEWSANFRLSVVLAALNKHDISRVWLGHLDGYADAQLAQNSRQCAAAGMASDNDWIMPADADLWPLRREPYHHHVGSNYRAVVAPYWNGDHFLNKFSFLKAVAEKRRSQTIPTCHVAMRARDWRKMYNLTPGADISVAVKRTLDDWFAHFPKDDFNVWMSDQDIMTWKLCQQEWFPDGTPPHHDPGIHASGDVLFAGRRGYPPVDRLCRSVPALWQMPFDPNAWMDAHMHKNPTALEPWAYASNIIQALLPQHAAWAAKYHKSYVEAV